MRRSTFVLSLLLAAVCSSTPAAADTFSPGSLIIPMDVDYQDVGMLKAYGLVYELLRSGVPVRWVIQSNKAFGGVDFTTTAKDHKSGAAVASHGYRGGPFVIDQADAAKALPLIDAWQASNMTTIHVATAEFSGDVARHLVVAPRIAMHADGNQGIARGYLMAAGIPDSNLDLTWPNTSPDMLTPAQVAGPTTTNHSDGKLFDDDGDPVYCQFMSMHWGVSDAAKSPETVAEVRQFLTNPVHFFAECQAVNAFENLVPYGHFLTTNGFTIKSQPITVDFLSFDQTFAQIDGPFGTVGGSEPAFALPPGDSYKATNTTLLVGHNSAPGTNDVWMTGYLDGGCDGRAQTCGSLGKVSYLGGHQYTVKVPISQNPKTQGVRLFLNSLFDSYCASQAGLPALSLVKSAPDTSSSATVTFTINYANLGPSVALNAVLTDPLPPGSAFVSATGGGTSAGGLVTWSLGNLGVGESGAVSFTVKLGSIGSYANTAKLSYKVGLNPFSLNSNTTSTLYDNDTDGDGVLDSVDDCPSHFDPEQNLASDANNCGSCGTVCSVANGLPECTGGACSIAACNPGFSDCDGAYSNGCEVNKSSFASDPNNCGGCGKVCSFFNASAACSAGACTVGTCSPGFSDCNGLPADGCEYSDAGLASDPDNCGSCGKKCAAGFICQGGSCVVDSCPAGFSDCNGLPADGCEYSNANFASDPSNCGACGKKCATGFVCQGGSCVVDSCPAGFSDCNGLPADGCEVSNASFASDPGNCGACGVVCVVDNGGGACVAGGCIVASCNPGFSDCNGLPADGCEYSDDGLASDPNNCGACGKVCSYPGAEGVCSEGACSKGACLEGFFDIDQNPSNGCEYACTPSAATDATCDGKDDDCDGQVDEDYSPTPCGQGACVASSVCKLGLESCKPGAPSAEGPAGDASCSDGVDNDCDGQSDGSDADCQVTGCTSALDCDDSDPCTDDACALGFCSHAGIDDCGAAGSAGTGGQGGEGGTASAGSSAGGESGAAGDAGAGGSGGDAGAGGDAGSGGDAGAGDGGQGGTGNTAGAAGQAGTTAAGSAGSGGKANGGSAGQGTGGASGKGASGGTSAAGSTAMGSEANAVSDAESGDPSGCGCRTAPAPAGRSAAAFLLLAASWIRRRSRRR